MQVGNPCNRTEEVYGCLNVGGAVGVQRADVRDGPHGRTKRRLKAETEGEPVTSMTLKVSG